MSRNVRTACPAISRPSPHGFWICIIALAAISAPATAANLVLNPSFELLNGETSSFKVDDPTTDTIPDWTAAPTPPNNILACLVYQGATAQMCGTLPAGGIGDNLSLWNVPGGGNGESPDGGNYILADGDSTYSEPLSQTINGLVTGKQYQLSFWQAAGQEKNFGTAGQSMNDTWKVSLGSQNFTGAVMTVAYQGTSAWSLQKINFTYSGSGASQVLSFLASSTAPSGNPPFLMLDGVSLVAQAPEPATWSYLLLTGVSICLIRKRFRKRA
jgi:hypothetical protein